MRWLIVCLCLGMQGVSANYCAVNGQANHPLQPVKTLKDHGIQGHTFPIKERSLLLVIGERLQQAVASGKLALLQQQFADKVTQKIMHPAPLAGIAHTTTPRTFYFDPSITQKSDIKDHQGRVIVKAGTTANPLDTLSWGAPWLFIDGDCPKQVAWALQQTGEIILVKGSPLTLHGEHDRWFYLDQGRINTTKLGITQVPAMVSQAGRTLKIEEITI